MWNPDDLIVAPATVGRGAARGIVRLSGAGLAGLLERLFHVAGQGFADSAAGGGLLEAVLAPDPLLHEWGAVPVGIIYWPGPAGPTGGPLAEVQLPGSPLLVEAVVAAACGQGARLARGGEFSLRAFLADRLDLLQAEAVLAVVEARSPAELSAALDRMAGGVGRQLELVRGGLLDQIADLNAVIDFSDETGPEAIPLAAAFWSRLAASLAAAAGELSAVAGRLETRNASARGQLPRVVFVGPPNIGKSSLFNALLGRAAALVADEAGTTRDWIEGPLPDPAGGPPRCLLVDVAGVSSAGDQATAAALAEMLRADVAILCCDAGGERLPEAGALLPAQCQRIECLTRADRPHAAFAPGTNGAIATSSLLATGIQDLHQAVQRALDRLPSRGSPATLRLQVGVAAALQGVEEARRLVEQGASAGTADEVLVASALLRAIESLGEVTGAEIGTDIIDRVFSRHCIGK